MITLHPYQDRVLEDVESRIAAGKRRILLVAPTGAGKTVLATEAVRRHVQCAGRVVFLAHRRELIDQAADKLFRAGIDHGVILAGHPTRPGELVQVASIATLHARAIRSSTMDLPPADLVVVDEAHHVRARTYQQIIAAYPDAVILGLTATPCRGDGRGLGKAFDTMVEAPSVAELTGLGYLVPARIYAPSAPDLKGVRTVAGDYNERELAERVDIPQLVGDVVTHWLRHAERRRTVVFACGVAHSLHLRDEFNRAGVAAEHLDGSTPAEERDAILKRLAAGTIDVVSNAMVLTEGWDAPAVSCLVLARPTKSLGLYRQMVGRVLRTAAGKVDAVILDHAGAVFQHGLPDDPITWTLDADKKAENRAHRARQDGRKSTGLATCPECAGVRLAGRPCEFCGWRPHGRAEGVEVVDGDLVEVGKNGLRAPPADSRAMRRAFHGQLVWIARERGYADGWAAHKFKEKFGSWPESRHVMPAEPDDATRSWVRSRQIAYAKAMQKQRGAA